MDPHEIFSHWEEVQQEFYALLDKIPERLLDETDPVGQSIRDLILSTVDEEASWMHLIEYGDEKWVKSDPNEFSSLVALLTHLKDVHARSRQILRNLTTDDLLVRRKMGVFEPTVLWILWHVIENTIHNKALCYNIAQSHNVDVALRWQR